MGRKLSIREANRIADQRDGPAVRIERNETDPRCWSIIEEYAPGQYSVEVHEAMTEEELRAYLAQL